MTLIMDYKYQIPLSKAGFFLSLIHKKIGLEGIEPSTPGFGDQCSAN
jgi:hypothetical protein